MTATLLRPRRGTAAPGSSVMPPMATTADRAVVRRPPHEVETDRLVPVSLVAVPKTGPTAM